VLLFCDSKVVAAWLFHRMLTRPCNPKHGIEFAGFASSPFAYHLAKVRLRSQGIPLSDETRLDFRRDYRALRYAVHQIPEEIQQALFALTSHYRLLYAAIDLLYTPEKKYVFLELNPVGQLGWLEQPTGLPLFRMLALLLTGRMTDTC
jgi:hypothetical protein